MIDKNSNNPSNRLLYSKNSIQRDDHDNDENEIIILEDKDEDDEEECKSEATEERFVQNMRRNNKIKQVMSIKINKSTFFNANSFVRGENKTSEMGGVTI